MYRRIKEWGEHLVEMCRGPLYLKSRGYSFHMDSNFSCLSFSTLNSIRKTWHSSCAVFYLVSHEIS